MIALHILDVKQFMSKLLLNDTFDHFLLSEAVITTYNTFHIDGRLQKDYYNPVIQLRLCPSYFKFKNRPLISEEDIGSLV